MLISKRVIFPTGKQRAFIERAEKTLGISDKRLAGLARICTRTMADWKREKFTMTLRAVRSISKRAGLCIPDDIKIREPYWYASKGAKAGGLAAFKKYGPLIYRDPKKREMKWREWWNKKGKYIDNSIIRPKPIKKPRECCDLAEFTGIFLGDGGLSDWQLTITLCSNEKQYGKFIVNLIRKLFNVIPSVYQSKQCRAMDIVVSRTALVRFCQEKLNIKPGSKIRQRIKVPEWIKSKMGYKVSCLRGLFDTDGTIFVHKYESKGKIYAYKKLGFTNRSLFLLKFANESLNDLGIKNRIAGNYDIRIEAKKDIDKFFKIVGTHNPNHLIIYQK